MKRVIAIVVWTLLTFIGLLVVGTAIRASASTLMVTVPVILAVLIVGLIPGLLGASRWRYINLGLIASIVALVLFAFTDLGFPDSPPRNAAFITAFVGITGFAAWALDRFLRRDSGKKSWTSRLWSAVKIAVVIWIAMTINMLLLVFFNPLQWPFLWPQPLLYILLAVICAYLLFPSMTNGAWLHRVIGALMLFAGQALLLHTLMVVIDEPSVLGMVYLIGFAGVLTVTTLNYINQLTPKAHKESPAITTYESVAVIVPTYGEPLDVLENTIAAILRLDYPQDKLFIVISDDAHNPAVRELTRYFGVHYNPGAKKDAKAGNLNSALAYIKRHAPQTTLVLTQDADEVIHPYFLVKTVGFFNLDPKMAFVQGGKEAFAPPNDLFGTRDRIFYDVMQVGRNGFNSAFSCGSAVLWRMEALESIGGFVTWNVVEDMTTSYYLHAAGYRSEYVSDLLSIGLSPEDIPGLLKQRGTWAVDNWRLFLFDNPLFRKGLSLPQRLQYLELGLFYACTAFFTPLIMLVPVWTLNTGQIVPIQGAALFPWMMMTAMYYIAISHGNIIHVIRMWQYWVGLGPTYFLAFLVAIRSRNKKPTYKVTRKTRINGFYGHLIMPQIIYVGGGVITLIRAFVSPPEMARDTLIVNVLILLFFMVMFQAIIRAAFYKVSWGSKPEQETVVASQPQAT
jgi:cellulose synthase (UDP-forming)